MKFIIAMITTLVIFSAKTHAFDQWCPQAPEVNYRATLAVDNINFLEEEVRYYYSNRTRGAIGAIQGLRGVLNQLVRITDFDQVNCYTIQANFYTADWQLRALSDSINRLLARRTHPPVQSTWNTFVRSFIELERVIIELGGGYDFPRGPFYRRYFPGFRRYFPRIRPGRRVIRRNLPPRRVIRSRSGTVDRGSRSRVRRERRLERRERRLDRRERRLDRRERRVEGRSGRRNINRNPNRNPNRNINRNPNRNPNSRRSGSRRGGSRRDRRNNR